MAQQSMPWTTNGTGDGPGSGYSQSRWYAFFKKLFTTDQEASEGVILGEDSELAVSGTSSPLTVASGSAIVHGFFYENTSSTTVSVTNPSATTGGHVVLEADWTAQTVRVAAYKNTDGVTSAPALTQTAGTKWQIRLATFTITSAGVITVTDARSYCHFGTKVNTAMIDDSAVTTAKINNDAITAGKLGAGVMALMDRQGSNANDWDLAGTTNYDISSEVRIQAGASSSASNAASYTFTITFPVAFDYKPLVFATTGRGTFMAAVTAISTTGITITATAVDGVASTNGMSVHWMAIGPSSAT